MPSLSDMSNKTSTPTDVCKFTCKMTGHITRGTVIAKGVGERPENSLDSFFLTEIETQCEFAHRSFGQMQEVAQEHPKSPSLLALAHMVLVFGGNVAKILSPSASAPSFSKRRARRLTQALGLSTISFDSIRQARNYVEHFDERMHRFLLLPGTAGVRQVTIHRAVLDHEPTEVTVDGKGEAPFATQFLQLLNTSKWELIFFGERFNIPEIVTLLDGIKSQVANAKTQSSEPSTAAPN